MRFSRGIHWYKPTIMFTALVVGTAFAIGHHCFYRSLRNKPTPDGYLIKRFGLRLSDQQLNIAAGSAFAFLVKALLGLAVSTAFGQIVWMVARKPASIKVKTADSLFSLLGDIFFVFHMKLWTMFPGLMLVVLVSWLLPLASIVTPATLSVELAVTHNSSFIQVPRVDFTSMNFAVITETEIVSLTKRSALDEEAEYYYNGPQFYLQTVVESSAAQGEILPIPAPFVNSSWALNFTGPALRCNEVNDTLYEDIIINVQDAMESQNCTYYYRYLSWIPGECSNGSLPYSFAGNGTPIFQSPRPGASTLLPTFFVATFPGPYVVNYQNNGCHDTGLAFVNSTISECVLYNASYSTDFAYTNGVQRIGIDLAGDNGDVSFVDYISGQYPLVSTYPNGSYQLDPIVYNATIVENFAYQAVRDAFAGFLTGSLAEYRDADNGDLTTSSTTILSTTLATNNELAFLVALQTRATINDVWNGASVTVATRPTMSLTDVLEQLFQNTTINLMSSEFLRPNYSSPYAPPNTTVVFTTYENIYLYSASILWIAYGLAISFSLLCVLYGSFAIFYTNASYSSDFSTIMRTTRNAELSIALTEADTRGEDPLPKKIAKADIMFFRPESESNSDEAMSLRSIGARPRSGSDVSSVHQHSSTHDD